MGNKSSQTVDNITNTVSSNILTVIQNIQNETTVNQQITGKCTIQTIQQLSSDYTNCLLKYVDVVNNDDDLLDICSAFSAVCKMNDINLSSNLNVDNISASTDTIKQEVKNSINNTLTQFGGNKTNQYIKNITNVSDDIAASIISNIQNNSNLTQTINLNGVGANNISIKSALKLVNNTVQNNSTYQSNIQNIANIITQINSNQNDTYKSLIIFAIVVAMSGVLISVIMTLKRSSDINDFFRRIAPVLVWVVVCAIIIILHILLKPDYVSYYSMDLKTKYIDKEKFFFIMLGYCIAVGILIKGYLVVKSKF